MLEAFPMMRLTSLAATLLLTLTAVVAQTPPKVPPALVPLQGTWIVSTINGQALGGEMALVIQGDRYHQIIDGSVDERGGVTIDPKAKPMTIDLAIEEGLDAGKKQMGIVEVTGDTMKLTLNLPGGTSRPSSFGAEVGFLMVDATRKK
jgi:uncharacterized protein (TIGR03067 family)